LSAKKKTSVDLVRCQREGIAVNGLTPCGNDGAAYGFGALFVLPLAGVLFMIVVVTERLAFPPP
jgi:hypothetical protein